MSTPTIELVTVAAAGLAVGILVWALVSALGRRRLRRTREFFGLVPDGDCLLVVNKSGSGELSVPRRDVLALVELAGLVARCGAQAQVVSHDEVRRGFGEKAEFCVGANSRTAAHLEWKLPGVDVGKGLRVADRTYGADHVLIARITDPDQSRPVFLVCGSTPVTNQAAVRYLVTHERTLIRRYGIRNGFCAVLKVVNPDAYGPDVVEWVGDVSAAAFRPPAPPKPPAPAKPAPAKPAVAAKPTSPAKPPAQAKPAGQAPVKDAATKKPTPAG